MPRSVFDENYTKALRKFKADIFQVLAHPTRIHIIESLRDDELSVGELLKIIEIEPANLSQHLSVLKAKNLVSYRKEGNQVFYTLRDPLLSKTLDSMRLYFQAHLEEAMAMLRAMDEEL